MYKKNKKKSINMNKVKFFIILVLIFIILKIINFTISKYEASSNSTANLGIAYYILKDDYQTMSVNLGSLLPREEPYVYTFSVANNDGTNRLETNLEYDLTIRTTTNLPLQFELYKNENYSDSGAQNIITSVNTETDEYDTYFTTYTTEKSYFGFTNNEQNTYNLVVYFPSVYSSIQYQDIIENIEVVIESKQII